MHKLFNIIRDSYGSPSYAMAYNEEEAFELCTKFQKEDEENTKFIAIEVDSNEFEKIY